jgi:hypothetical protein
MEINLKSKKWSEIVLIHFPRNWQYYKSLVFDFYNPNAENIKFEIKIGDHFSMWGFFPKARKFVIGNTLKTGWNTICIDVNEIAEVINISSEKKIIHLRILSEDCRLYIDNMRIEI